MKRVGTLLCFVAMCLFLATGIMAQGQTTGTISGIVLDSDGKAVVGATVTVTDQATNTAFPAVKTNSDGRYSLADVAPGSYTITIEMTNFKKSVTKDVTVITGRNYDLSTKLEVGSAAVTMSVEAGGMQVIETQNTSTQATVSGRAITNLPFETRSAVILGVLDPGAQTVGGPRNSTFEGLPKGTINITFDGINIQDNLLKSSDGFFAINDPRIDDVEEFGITTTGNDPSKTGEGAVQMTYVSKRGGNAWHGGVWETNRNTDFDSNYYFNNTNGLPRQQLDLNEFGYKVSGPILKDRLFFFTDFDFFQFPQSLAVSRTILNTNASNGIFTYAVTASGVGAVVPTNGTVSCTATSGGAVTAASICTANLLGANSVAAQNGFNNPTDTVENSTVAFFQSEVNSSIGTSGVTIGAPPSPYQSSLNYNASTQGVRRYPDARLDFNLTKKDTIEFDYHYAWYDSAPDVLNGQQATYPNTLNNVLGSQGSQLSNRSLFVLAWRRTIGSNMSNELRAGIQSAPVNFGLGESLAHLPTINTNFATNQPTEFGISGESALFLGPGNTQGRNSALGQIHDTFSWTKGTHQFQFGFDETDIHYNDFFNTPNASSIGLGIASTDPLAALFTAGTASTPGNFPGISSTQLGNAEGLYGSLIGDITSYSNAVGFNPATRAFQTGIREVDNVDKLELGFFGGDSWRVRPTLTFNYGLRWEYDGPPSDKNNQYFMAESPNDVWGVSGPNNLFKPGSVGGAVGPGGLPGTLEFVNDQGKSWYNKYYRALAPSVGLAWQPNSENSILKHVLGGPGKTVIRAGYSIAYSREGLNTFFGVSQDNPGYTGAQSSGPGASNNAAAGTFLPGTVFLGPSGTPGSVNFVNQNPTSFQASGFPLISSVGTGDFVINPNLKPPMIQSWNAGIQRELNSNMVLEVRYQANHGDGLWNLFNLNEVNIFENGFLNEFTNATNNFNICQANLNTTCLAAEIADGIVKPTATKGVSDFGNLGLPGQVNLPIFAAAFTGSQAGAENTATTPSKVTFTNSTVITAIQNAGAGSAAAFLGSGTTAFNTFLGNLVAAGLPSNYFVVNPAATGGAFALANANESTYNALIVDLRHRPSHGLQFDVNYSFAKSLTNYNANSSIDNTSFPTLRNLEYGKGPAPFDTRHAIKGQAIYELPFGPNHRLSSSNGVVNRVIGGWEVNTITRFQTGQPVLIASGVTDGATFNGSIGGVNIVGMTVGQVQNLLATNKTEFPLAVGYVPTSLIGSGGTANFSVIAPCNVAGALCGRPFLTGPAFFRADLSLVKTTKITERVNLELRMEALNAFNDADFYWACGVGTSPCSINSTSTRFGQMGSNSLNGAYSDINTTQDPGGRIVQLVARVNF